MQEKKFTFSQDTECGIVRSNISPFNLNILLLGVPKRKHVTGEWRKWLHNLYSSPGHVARMTQGKKVYKVLVGKPEGKRPLGRPRRRREDGIRMDLRETGGDVNWIQLAQDRDRWRARLISRWIYIYIDTSRSINIDTSRCLSIYLDRYLSIHLGRYISIYLIN
jgi:hypothetical protein